MIEVIVNTTCPHCTKQLKIMAENFKDQHKVIYYGSKEFQDYDLASEVELVPFISIREAGKVTYFGQGYHTVPMLQRALLRSP